MAPTAHCTSSRTRGNQFRQRFKGFTAGFLVNSAQKVRFSSNEFLTDAFPVTEENFQESVLLATNGPSLA